MQKIVLGLEDIRDQRALTASVETWFDVVCGTIARFENVLNDWKQDVCFILTPVNTDKICADRYAYRVLLAIGRATQVNPHVQVRFAR
ncbi:MAG: hypothetical protein SOI44_02220 [Lactimicrobium sp.]|jgi:hypothetical protein|uniref:hypothetical protein n=1 Tax=Lactimicrobium sp. TaxID=2563780 RepID=UPI002F352AFE